MALGSMLHQDVAAEQSAWTPPDGAPHFAPRAKSVIWLFMVGGVSQMESFDVKPAINKYANMSLDDTPHAGVLENPLLDREPASGRHAARRTGRRSTRCRSATTARTAGC